MRLAGPLNTDDNGELPMKRQRGRGRGGKPGGGGGHQYHNNNQPNRTMESNGPEGKVRGPAALIYERYLQAARDAASSGDRVLAENFLQHADHYFRLLRQMQPAVQHQPQADRFSSGAEFEAEEEGADGESADESAGDESEPAEADGGEQEHAPQQSHQGGERDGEFRRNRGRGRRSRFRPEGERGEGEGAQAREDGGEQPRREPREPRPPREPRGEREESREGFAGPGPKPAFLGSD